MDKRTNSSYKASFRSFSPHVKMRKESIAQSHTSAGMILSFVDDALYIYVKSSSTKIARGIWNSVLWIIRDIFMKSRCDVTYSKNIS